MKHLIAPHDLGESELKDEGILELMISKTNYEILKNKGDIKKEGVKISFKGFPEHLIESVLKQLSGAGYFVGVQGSFCYCVTAV